MNPFPSDPQGGEFAWVVSAAGAGDSLAVAIDPAGHIVVAARQTGALTLGSLHVDAPTSAEALLVLELTADGQPIWARSFSGASRILAAALTTTASGDVVVGGQLEGGDVFGAGLAPRAAREQHGFVVVLAGVTGATAWSATLGDGLAFSDAQVLGIAAGRDSAGADAIYAYGQLVQDAVIAGTPVPAGAYLLRYDADGTLRWVRSFAHLHAHSAGLDPARGMVIAGRFGGVLTLDDQVLVADPGTSDGVVAGFDPDGHVRFARQVFSDSNSQAFRVSVAPGGDIFLGSSTERSAALVDDHLIPLSDPGDHALLIRLTPDGHYAWSTIITGGTQAESAGQVTVDAAGASYLLTSCHDRVNVQPEVDCRDGRGGVIVAYAADQAYRWATYVKSAFVEGIAATSGDRLIVVGEALRSTTDFGGVQVPTQQLFIAALAGGPARLPSPLPATPTIANVTIEGLFDREVRQGGSVTLRIGGGGLDHVTSARLGDLDVHVPAGAGTAGELRLPVTIPHGHAPGALTLVLGNAGGSAQVAGAVTVTPVVVAPTGRIDGRGTFASPMRLCRNSWFDILEHADVLLLRDGVHTCDRSGVAVPRGVIIRGESKARAVVRGASTGPFGGFRYTSGGFGVSAIENLTIESADSSAIFAGGTLAVTDVDIHDVDGSGVKVEGDAVATVTRYRYLRGHGSAISILGGRVDATRVEADQAFHGVFMTDGTLTLDDSSLSSTGESIVAGDLNTTGGTRELTITHSSLPSGISIVKAQLTASDTTIERTPDASGNAIFLVSSSLTLSNTTIRGWGTAIFTLGFFGSPDDAASIALDHVTITACRSGVWYDAGSLNGRFSLRDSRVETETDAVRLFGNFASADLGTPAAPGNNRLASSAAQATALVDARATAGAAIDARGTLLNGASFSGDILGPAAASGAYSIAGPNTIRF